MLKVISIHRYLMLENYSCPRGIHFSMTVLNEGKKGKGKPQTEPILNPRIHLSPFRKSE